MSNVVTTRRGWFQRIGDSIKGIITGLVLFLIAFPVLWLNEGRAVKTARALDEGAANVVSVSPDTVDASNQGKLIHTTAPLTTEGVLADSTFGVSADNLVRMRRVVEMYQWRENRREERQTNVGGSETVQTTYTYEQTWSSSAIDSSGFHDAANHRNPGAMPYPDEEFRHATGRLGAFEVSENILSRFGTFQPLRLTEETFAALPETVRSSFQLHDGGLYRGANPATPAIGDVRVRFEQVPEGVASVVAQQTGNGLGAYRASNGRELLFVRVGQASADEIFASEQAANVTLTWILRFVGWLLMFLGLTLVFRPLGVIADVLPIAGSIVRTGTGLVAVLIASPLSLLTVALAWFAYRPLLSIVLLLIGGGIGFGLFKVWKKPAPAAAPTEAPAA